MAPTRSSKPKPGHKRSADLAEIAFERLQQAILTGELKEGERVRETRLATEWALGITPLREAVRRMAAIGYVVLKPNHAPLVRRLTVKDIRQIYEIREVLECVALRSTWESVSKMDLRILKKAVAKVEVSKTAESRLRAQFALDNQLHRLWISPPDNPWLAAILERLLIYRPNLANVLSQHTIYADEAFEQHKQILQAIEAQNLRQTIRQLTHHIQQSGATLVALTKP